MIGERGYATIFCIIRSLRREVLGHAKKNCGFTRTNEATSIVVRKSGIMRRTSSQIYGQHILAKDFTKNITVLRKLSVLINVCFEYFASLRFAKILTLENVAKPKKSTKKILTLENVAKPWERF